MLLWLRRQGRSQSPESGDAPAGAAVTTSVVVGTAERTRNRVDRREDRRRR